MSRLRSTALDARTGSVARQRALRRISSLALIGLVLPGTLAMAEKSPSLDQTELYGKTTHSCKDSNPARLARPVKDVLAKYAIPVDRVQICNDGKYLILTVHFKYDPQGLTTSYFHPLYAEMGKANGGRPFSFVDLDDREIIDIMLDTRNNIDVRYESFPP